MIPRAVRSFRSWLVTLAIPAGGLVLAACGGEFRSQTESETVVPGSACSRDGDQADAADGCNTCECVDGTWACTERACGTGGSSASGGASSTGGGSSTGGSSGSGGATGTGGASGSGGIGTMECSPGETRDAEDGCNTCTCTAAGTWSCTRLACQCTEGQEPVPSPDGCNSCSCVGNQWVCTNVACPVELCPPPTQPPPGVSCPAVEVVARHPTTGLCCPYSDPCHAPEGWGVYYSQAECENPSCLDGETMPAGDGCNTCTCQGGTWGCTERYCPTERICGGFAGFTCEATEYCAYEEGQYCGAADASSVCKPRPDACDTVYDPVCGCDGETHGNACEAAMKGTGVMSSGPCITAD